MNCYVYYLKIVRFMSILSDCTSNFYYSEIALFCLFFGDCTFQFFYFKTIFSFLYCRQWTVTSIISRLYFSCLFLSRLYFSFLSFQDSMFYSYFFKIVQLISVLSMCSFPIYPLKIYFDISSFHIVLFVSIFSGLYFSYLFFQVSTFLCLFFRSSTFHFFYHEIVLFLFIP